MRKDGKPLHQILDQGFKGDGEVTVGIPANLRMRRNDGTRVAMWKVAMWLEYGVPSNNLEPRPAITQAFRENAKKYQRSLRSRLIRVKKGQMDPRVAYGRLGAQMVKDVQISIDLWRHPENRETQAKLKGHKKPLVFTGRMKRSYTYTVYLEPPKKHRNLRIYKIAKRWDQRWRTSTGRFAL
jgi:hypothetical protein